MTPSLHERIIHFAVEHARLVVIGTFVVTLVFGWFAVRVRVNPDFNSLLPQNAAVRTLLKEYGGGSAPADLLVFAATGSSPGGDVLAPDSLAAYGEAIQAIGALPGVQSVTSPFNLVSFGRENGRLAFRPMSPGGAVPGPDAAAEFRSRLGATGYARNLVVSADGTMLITFIQTDAMGSFKAFMGEVDAIAAKMRARGLTPYVTGTIPLSVRTEFYLTRDTARLLALAAFIILLSYVGGFRSLRAVVLPLLSVLLGTVWTIGFMGIAGFSLSLITIVAPPLILIFGNEYNIYTTSEYMRMAREDGALPGWIERATRNVSKPIIMAFLTTMVGFLSLLTTSIRQTREFAITASFGSLACAFLALFFLPAMLSLLTPPRVRPRHHNARFDRLMSTTARFAVRFPVLIFILLGCVALLFALTVPRLNFNTDPASYFPRGDPVLRDMASIYGKAGGYEQVSVSFDAPRGATGYFLDTAVLAQVESIEQKLRALPDISYGLSLPGLLREINAAATGKDELPANRAVISTFARLLGAVGASSPGASLLANLTNRDFTRVTLSFRMYNSSTGHYMDEARIRELLAAMHATLAANPIGATPVIWTTLLQNLSFADSLRQSLILSMIISVLSILVLTIVVFRSPLYGLYPLVPLMAALLLNFAMMALSGIPLDMTTIMVSNIAIGVGVDGAIYLVIQYRRELALATGQPGPALQRTLQVMGLPLLLSSLSIVVGLLAFATAAFRPIVYFGVLVLFTLVATTLGTLVTLPALLAVDTRVRLARARRRGGPRGSA